jgi:hypothetical protein
VKTVDDRRLAIGSLLLLAVVLIVAVLIFQKHQDEVVRQNKIAEAAAAAAEAAAAAANAAAKYHHLKEIDDNVSAPISRFRAVDNAFDAAVYAGSSAGQSRHDLYNSPPVDPNNALSDARQELQSVEQLTQLSQERAEAARNVATAFGAYYGDATTNALLSEITSAAEVEGKYAADWWRAANQITDSLTAQVNGRFSFPSENVGSLYQASDEEGAESKARWNTVTAKITDLQNRLEADIAKLGPLTDSTPAVPLGTRSIFTPAPASP